MKLVNFETNGLIRVGLLLGDEIVDLSSRLGPALDDVAKFLAMGAEARKLAQSCVKWGARQPITSVRLRSPLARPKKILGVGMNYHSFVAAAHRLGLQVPVDRLWFYRPNDCIVGPYDDVWLPRYANDFDYEAELAIVIGTRCRYVTLPEAASVIAGYTVANDLTLRERVLKSIVLGKSFDTHTPLGPCVVTADEIRNPQTLAMKTWVNGHLRQNGTTADMIRSCYELVADISSVCTLNPGDIILTGTPDGSGLFLRPPERLVSGDSVKIEIEGIGSIENRVVDEPPVSVRPS